MESKASEQFWILSSPLLSDRKLAERDFNKNEPLHEHHFCSLNQEHVGSKRIRNLKILLKGGSQDDMVWTWDNDWLVQKRVLDFLKNEGYSGLTFQDVQARFKNKKTMAPLPILWEVQTTGYAGMLLSDVFRVREHCDLCGTERYAGEGIGVAVNPATWDGSDFFIAWPLPLYIFVSDRAAKGLLRAGFSGFSLVCPEDLEIRNGCAPGSLAYWISAEKLKEFKGLPPHPGAQSESLL